MSYWREPCFSLTLSFSSRYQTRSEITGFPPNSYFSSERSLNQGRQVSRSHRIGTTSVYIRKVFGHTPWPANRQKTLSCVNCEFS